VLSELIIGLEPSVNILGLGYYYYLFILHTSLIDYGRGGGFKALLRDLVFVLITIHSSALFKIYLYTLRYLDILE
jgi:hypothetical protein